MDKRPVKVKNSSSQYVKGTIEKDSTSPTKVTGGDLRAKNSSK